MSKRFLVRWNKFLRCGRFAPSVRLRGHRSGWQIVPCRPAPTLSRRLVAKEFIPSRQFATALLVLLGLALCGAFATACMYSEFNSVHFHSGQPDFGLPPRRAVLPWHDEPDDRSLTTEIYAGDRRTEVELGQQDASETEKETPGLALQVAAIVKTAKAGQWHKARLALEQVATTDGWRGALRDETQALKRMEALKLLQAKTLVASLRRYLDGMDVLNDAEFDGRKEFLKAQPAFQSVYNDPKAGFLREHALYQLASLAREYFDYPRAIALYQQFLREFPKSIKREDTLIMIARCAILPKTEAGRNLPVGQQALSQLEKEFPKTRFHRSILGLRARIHYLAKQWPQALNTYFALDNLDSVEIVLKEMPNKARGAVQVRLLATYLRRLLSTHDLAAYSQAVWRIDRLRKLLSVADAGAFARLLLRTPDLASSYLYYRLYHCNIKPHDLANLTQLADAIAAKYSASSLSPLVKTRLAEVYYQRQQYAKALTWANRAMQSRAFDRALYVRGATRHKLKRYRSALADFNALLRRFPKSPLRRGAREEAALLHEAVGDLGGALDQYFALDYDLDSAYLLDVRMTPPQIEAYLRRHPDAPGRIHLIGHEWLDRASAADSSSISSCLPNLAHTRGIGSCREWNEPAKRPKTTLRDLLAYTLGIRYLREEKWRLAERWLKRVPQKAYKEFSKGNTQPDGSDSASPDPLTSLRALRKLHRAIGKAKSNNARAEAMYRYASYYSTHGTLLLYNAALWNGTRAFGFGDYWNTAQATKQDTAIVRKYMYEHEIFARSRAICLEVARRYPHTPIAPRALYRAACASRRLVRFNGWWDTEEKRHDFGKESVRLMQQVARRYPHSSVAAHAQKYAKVFAGEVSW